MRSILKVFLFAVYECTNICIRWIIKEAKELLRISNPDS